MITQEESLKRKALGRFQRDKPNELWQMDFKGHFQLFNASTCFPLTIIDDHSRFSLCLKACLNETKRTVKQGLITVFKHYGMPIQINVDNGNPWGHSNLTSYTQLTVWLMQLGIRVTHSRPRHPQTNGKIERFHRTLKKEVLQRHKLRHLRHAQQVFDDWLFVYNNKRPHEALDMDVPVRHYQKSTVNYPDRLPDIYYPEGSITRKVRGNGHLTFNGKTYSVGEAFKGFYVEVKPNQENQKLELYFGKHKIYQYNLDE